MIGHYVIAIDGPAGSGKSTTAAGVAQKLSIVHLDTGAMYRTLTLKALETGIADSDTPALRGLAEGLDLRFERAPSGQRVFLEGRDVTAAIRTERVSNAVSAYSRLPEVRTAMVRMQRQAARGVDIVLEGRDIGTVVFPDARYKFFLTASIEERARRRCRELLAKGETADPAVITSELIERDRKDSTRAASPLRKADDAVEIDTTGLSIEEQINRIVSQVQKDLHP